MHTRSKARPRARNPARRAAGATSSRTARRATRAGSQSLPACSPGTSKIPGALRGCTASKEQRVGHVVREAARLAFAVVVLEGERFTQHERERPKTRGPAPRRLAEQKYQ